MKKGNIVAVVYFAVSLALGIVFAVHLDAAIRKQQLFLLGAGPAVSLCGLD
jgi:hypothetical protein